MAGLKAKRVGQAWEDVFHRACGHHRASLTVTRIPDGCKRVGPRTLVQVKVPFDWVLTHAGRTALVDTKSCSGAFPHSHIEGHQISAMLGHSVHGAIGGYVIWLRTQNHVVFIPATKLVACYGTRGSIDQDTPGVTLLGPCGNIDVLKIFG